MTQQSAERDATIWAGRILTLLRDNHASLGLRVPLSFYPSPHDYETLRPGETWSWQHYAAVLQSVSRQLNAAGYRSVLVPCTAADCLTWLDERGLPSNPTNRARYVAELAAEQPR